MAQKFQISTLKRYWQKLFSNKSVVILCCATILPLTGYSVASSAPIPLPEALDFIDSTLDRVDSFIDENIFGTIDDITGIPEIRDAVEIVELGVEIYDRTGEVYDRINSYPDRIKGKIEGYKNCWSNIDIRTAGKCLPPGESSDAIGEIGLREIYSPTAGLLLDNPFIIEQEIINLYDEENARIIASQYLDEAGQQWLEKKIATNKAIGESNSKIIKDISKNVKKGSKEKVTQKILKESLKVEQKQAELQILQSKQLAALEGAITSLEKQQAALLTLQTNIAEDFGELNRNNQLEREALHQEYNNSTFYLPGLF